MVMCVGTREYHTGYRPRSRPPLHRPSSIVYFPSQDAITASVIPRGVNMWASGTKRKLDVAEVEETQTQNYFEQRQSILNISMIKLRTQPIRKVEQPLRRSVLIFNTLKQIETELKVEGVRMNLPTKPSLLPALEPSQDDTLDAIPAESTLSEHKALGAERLGCSGSSRGLVAMDTTPSAPLRGVIDSPALSSVPASSDSLFSDSRSIDSLFSMSGSQQGPLPTFSSLLDLDSCTPPSSSSSSPYCISSTSSSSSAASSPNLPASLSSSPLNTAASPSLSSGCLSQHSTSSSSSPALSSYVASPSSSSPHLSSQATFHTPLPSTATPTAATTMTSAEPDPLSDFDFSALDVEFFSYLPSGIKLPSLSPEDLQSLPHPETFPPALSASCNPKHTDLLTDDLDSIMQILVGI